MSQYYGRKWKITVTSSSGEQWIVSDSSMGEKALQCSFRVDKAVGQCSFSAMVSMWNLNVETEHHIIEEGNEVVIEAGYVNGPYGRIFKGNVFQPVFDRDNVTDFRTTLYCLNGFDLWNPNLTSVSLQSGYDYRALISALARNAHNQVAIGTISESLDAKKAPRGIALIGDLKDLLRPIAQDNNAQFWTDDEDKLNMTKFDDGYATDALVISPETGLIGSPEQTSFGVWFRSLLNPNITIASPYMVVKLDQATIRTMKACIGQYLTPLDQDGQYKVVAVTYRGSTRGHDWYVDVTGINLEGAVSPLFPSYSGAGK
jgi:hypothetical protein